MPLLLDTVTRRIVCNESALILRDINSCFNSLARFPAVDLRPPHLADAIDIMNDSMFCPPIAALPHAPISKHSHSSP